MRGAAPTSDILEHDGAQGVAAEPRESLIQRARKPKPHVPVGFAYGAVSALVSLMAIGIVTFAAWLVDSASSASWNDTFSVTIAIWSAAQRGHVHTNGTTVVFAPILLSLLCIASVRIGAKAAFPAERVSLHDMRQVMIAFVLGYVVAGQVFCFLASLGHAGINPFTMIIGPAIIAGLGVLWAVWKERDGSPELTELGDSISNAMPLFVRRSWGSCRRGLWMLAGLSLLLVLFIGAWHFDTMMTITRQLKAGASGNIFMGFAQLLALPNMMADALGWSTGAPLRVGEVVVRHSDMRVGTLPLVPTFGALPNGSVTAWSWLSLLIPVFSGGYLGWDAAGSLTKFSSLRSKVLVALSAAVSASAVCLIIMWFATASVSTGLLRYVGPGWQAWPLLVLELVLPAMIAAAIRHTRMNRPGAKSRASQPSAVASRDDDSADRKSGRGATRLSALSTSRLQSVFRRPSASRKASADGDEYFYDDDRNHYDHNDYDRDEVEVDD